LRVSGTGVLAHYYGTEVADGFFHSFSGWVIYIAAFLLLFGVGWVLDRFRPATEKESVPTSPSEATVMTDERSGVVSGAASTATPVIQVEGTD